MRGMTFVELATYEAEAGYTDTFRADPEDDQYVWLSRRVEGFPEKDYNIRIDAKVLAHFVQRYYPEYLKEPDAEQNAKVMKWARDKIGA